DSSYVDLCQTGKEFDIVLEKLGGKRIIPRQDCDVDYEDEAAAWQQALLDAIDKKPNGAVAAAVTNNNGVVNNGALNGVQVNSTHYSRKNPFEATILEKINLSGKGSSKENIHLELSLDGSGLQYEPGDALGVYGANAPSLIEGVLNLTDFSGNEIVESYQGEKTLV